MLAFVCLSLGLVDALSSYLDSLGLAYLPASTFSLTASSRLAFNAFLSFFINSMTFTPCIINSSPNYHSHSPCIQADDTSHSTRNTKSNQVLGFIASLAGSVSYGLFLSLTQLAFEKVLKRNTLSDHGDDSMCVPCGYICYICGAIASGEWNELKKEMEEPETGKASYVLNLTFTAINWQLYTVDYVGLTSEVSSIFSNAMMVPDVPIVPILAMFIFHDKMDPLMLAVWGFMSFFYQYHLDHRHSNTEDRN